MKFTKGSSKRPKGSYLQDWNSLPMRIWTSGIISDSIVNTFFCKILFLFSSLQIIFTTLHIYLININHNGVAFDQTAFELVRIIALINYIDLNLLDAETKIILIFVLFYSIFFISIITIFVYHLAVKKRMPAKLSQSFLSITYFHTMIMALPMSSLALQIIFQSVNDTNISKGYMAVAVFIEVLNLLYALGGCLLYIKLKTKDPFGRLNNIYIGNILLQKLILNLFIISAINRPKVGTFVVLPISFSIVFEIITKLSILIGIPFFKYKLNKYASLASCVSSVLSLSTLLHYLYFKDTQRSWGYNYFLGCCLIFLLMWKAELSFLNNKRHNLDFLEETNSWNIFWIVQKILFVKKELNRDFQIEPEDPNLPKTHLIISGAIPNFYKILIKRFGTYVLEADSKELITLIIKYALSNNRYSVILKLLLSHSLLYDQRKINEPSSSTIEIISTSISIPDILSGLKVQSDLRKAIREVLVKNKEVLDVPLYFKQNEKIEEFRSLVIHQIETHDKIYNKLLEPKFVLLSFMRINYRYFKEWDRIDILWEKHLDGFSRRAFGTILIYAFYNIFNRHDQSKGFELLNRYKSALTENLSILKSSKLNSRTLFDPSNISVIISASRISTGRIFHISPNVKSVFGHNAEIMRGKNISMLMPKFFHSLHNQFILKKCEDEKNISAIKTITTFAIDAKGFMIPVKIFACAYPLIDDGLMIWGMMRADKPINDYMLVNENYEMEGYTQSIANDLRLDPKQTYRLPAISKELHTTVKYISKVTATARSFASIGSQGVTEKTEKSETGITGALNNTILKGFMTEVPDSPALQRFNDSEYCYMPTTHSHAQEMLKEGRTMLIFPASNSLGSSMGKQDAFKYTIKCEVKQFENKYLKLLTFQKFFDEKAEIEAIINKNQKIVTNTVGRINEQQPSILLDVNKVREDGDISSAEEFSEQLEYSSYDNELDPVGNHAKKQNNRMPSSPTRDASYFVEPHSAKADRLPFFRPKQNDKSELFKRNPKAKPISSFFQNDNKLNYGLPKGIEYIASLGKFTVEKLKAKTSNTTDLMQTQDDGYLEYVKSNASSEYKSAYITLQQLRKSFKLFKFHKGTWLKWNFFIINIYIVAFLLSILILYLEATEGVPEIKRTMVFTHSLIQAMDNFYIMLQAHFVITLDLQITRVGYYVSSTRALETSTKAIINKNNELFNSLGDINVETREAMTRNDLKIFYDDYKNFMVSSSYNTYNYFEAMKLVTAQTLRYSINAKYSAVADPLFANSQAFLNVNLYNDLLLRTSELISLASNQLSNQVSDLQFRSTLILLCYGSFTLFCIISNLYFLSRTINETKDFAIALFGTSYEEEINNQVMNLKLFKECLDQDNYNELINTNKGFTTRRSEGTVKLNPFKNGGNSSRIKVLTSSYSFLSINRFLQKATILTGGVILVIVSSILFMQNMGSTAAIYNDMIKAGEIASQLQLVFTESTQITINPAARVKNQLAKDIIDYELDLLSTKISKKYTGFSLQFLEMLSQDYCPYRTGNFSCSTILNGIAREGILSSIYLLKSVLMKQMDIVNKYTYGTPTYFYYALGSDITDAFNIAYSAIVPALDHYIQQRADDLVSLADKEADKIINDVIICLVLGIVSAIGPWIFYYPSMINERRGLANSLMVLPLRIILKNRLFKEFLLKDSKEFYQMISRHEEMGESEDKNLPKKKKSNNNKKRKRLFSSDG